MDIKELLVKNIEFCEQIKKESSTGYKDYLSGRQDAYKEILKIIEKGGELNEIQERK